MRRGSDPTTREQRIARVLEEMGRVATRLDAVWDLVEDELPLAHELARLRLGAALLSRLARNRLIGLQTERAAAGMR
jgi:hypothetical protein